MSEQKISDPTKKKPYEHIEAAEKMIDTADKLLTHHDREGALARYTGAQARLALATAQMLGSRRA